VNLSIIIHSTEVRYAAGSDPPVSIANTVSPNGQ
jgi:hypothetical protein